MAITLAIIAALFYALQGTLMAPFYRRLDPLEATAIRGLSLGLSMLPLVIISGEVHQDIFILIPALAVSAIVTIFANWFGAIAVNFIPVGINGAISVSTSTLLTTCIGYFVIGESLYTAQLLGISILIASNVFLGFERNQGHAIEWKPAKGIFFAAVAGMFGSIGGILTGLSARQGMPFTSGYFWEFFMA